MFRCDTLWDYFLQGRGGGLLCASHTVSPCYSLLDPHSLLQHHSNFNSPLTQEPHIGAPTYSSFGPYTSGPFPIPPWLSPCPPSEVESWEQPPQQSHNSCSLPVAFLTFLVYSKTIEIFYFWLFSWPLRTSLPSCPPLHPDSGFPFLLDGLCFTSCLL